MKNGYSTDDLETFITPSLKEDLPVIHLPGDEKFSSYKNTFQEYCQKKHLTVPSYKVKPEGDGFVGRVSFSLNHVRSEMICSTIKEAEQRVAFDALQQIGYLQEVKFQMVGNPSKRKSCDVGSESPAKQMKVGDITVGTGSAKCQLNEIAQKKKFPTPVYNSVSVAGGFTCTVQFNGNSFKSDEVFLKRKASEQGAAEVCLKVLQGEL